MKKIWITTMIIAGSILIAGLWFIPGLAGAHTNTGGMMGYGMMGQEEDMLEECEEMMEGLTDHQDGTELTQEDAISIVKKYLKETKNPNLEVGEVERIVDEDYLVEIVTKDGSLVDKLEVNRFSGWIHSIYAE